MSTRELSRRPGWGWLSTRALACCLLALLSAPQLWGAVYFIDFDGGDDARDGRSPAAAFKHCPGDPAASTQAAAVELQAGDLLRFRGGVAYRGCVAVTASGIPGRPLVFDGNTDGAWGRGPAILDGGDPLTGWRRCASSADAQGNPRWSDLFFLDVPQAKRGQTISLCDAETALPLAQHPNPHDPFWQEDLSHALVAPGPLKPNRLIRVTPEPGTRENRARPLSLLVANDGKSSAAIEPLVGGGFTITLEAPAEIVATGLTPQPKYAAIKDVVFLGDGRELTRGTLARDVMGPQRFPLSTPATITQLTVRVLSGYTVDTGGFTAIRQVAAFDHEGRNVIAGPDHMHLRDPANLNHPTPDYYIGMTLAFHAGNNAMHYRPITGYDPATGTLEVPLFLESQYPQTRYSMLNAVRLIDQPGEYSVTAAATGNEARVHLLPRRLADGQPEDVAVSARAAGFTLEGASHVTVRGFLIRRQAGSALNAQGPAEGIIFRNCEISLVRGNAVTAERIRNLVVERCHVHHNPGHSKGILLRNCTDVVTRDCRLVANTSTGIDYYGCTNGVVADNTVLDHRGMHANGLTFYLGCRNIRVERNRVANGRCALTFQQGEGFVFRDNLFDGGNRSMVVGIWPAQPLSDVQFHHNTIIRSDPNSTWAVGLFSNSRNIQGLVVASNIIDGVCSDHDVFRASDFHDNLYTRVAKDNASGPLGPGDRSEPNLAACFENPEAGDFRPRAGITVGARHLLAGLTAAE